MVVKESAYFGEEESNLEADWRRKTCMYGIPIVSIL